MSDLNRAPEPRLGTETNAQADRAPDQSNPSNRLYGSLTLDEIKQRALRIEWEPPTLAHDWLVDFAIAVYALTNSLTFDSPFSEEEANPHWTINAEISGTME